MPETLAHSTLEQRVAAAVAEHRDELERLVRDHVERLLGEIVDIELASRSNGNTAAAPLTKVCRSCGQEKPAGAFDKHRRSCRSCRTQQARDRERHARAAPDDGDAPRPDTAAPTE